MGALLGSGESRQNRETHYTFTGLEIQELSIGWHATRILQAEKMSPSAVIH